MATTKLHLKPWDGIVVALLLLAAAVFFALWQKDGASLGTPPAVEIYVDGQLMRTVPIPSHKEEVRIETAYGVNLLHIGPEGVAMAEADCASRDCVHTAPLTRADGAIACLPHRLLVRLSGNLSTKDAPEEVDVVAG
ncbi:NusG domain II-containing protein [Ruminococcaceae bacterium OttesenSCG-928-L11]|nr:NusG domain II-containing protein [Ruminococcaceae bacterium OttesenSCG-928-L11]